eukprot:4707367-Amphidinium_carterae.1
MFVTSLLLPAQTLRVCNTTSHVSSSQEFARKLHVTVLQRAVDVRIEQKFRHAKCHGFCCRPQTTRCGRHDDGDFTARTLCCACGGGASRAETRLLQGCKQQLNMCRAQEAKATR